MPRSTLLVAATSVCLIACAPPPKAAPAPLPPPVEVPFPRELQPEVQSYLRSLAARLEPAWRQTIAMAASLLPASDPSNRLERMTEIELELDWNGQASRIRVSRPSGHPPFDSSALRTVAELGILPPLPALVGERRATIYWRFHRDGRGASPGAARFELRAVAPEDLLRRTLAQGQYDRAAALLERAGASASLLAICAEAGLGSSRPALRLAAIPLASAEQLRALLEREREVQIWERALEELVVRKEAATLGDLVEGVVKVGASADAKRGGAVLRAFARAGRTLPDATARKLLAHPQAALALAAATATGSGAILDEAIARDAKRPERAGPFAVRRCQLAKSEGCEAAIRAALTGTTPEPTLAALEQARLSGFDTELAAIATKGKPAARARALALGVGLLEAKVVFLGLRAKESEVQLAALRALVALKLKRPALVRRLTDLTAAAQGRLLAEALAALARLGDEGSQRDSLRRFKRLDAEGQALVAAALHGYGESAVATLAPLLAHASREVREAAAASLRAIPGEKAKAALAGAPAATTATPAGLEGLLRSALKLRRPGS